MWEIILQTKENDLMGDIRYVWTCTALTFAFFCGSYLLKLLSDIKSTIILTSWFWSIVREWMLNLNSLNIIIVKTSCMIFDEYYLKFYKKELTCFILEQYVTS